MKKVVFTLLAFSIFSSVSAGSVTCTDLSSSLSRGAESSAVLSLQKFLFAKGILKVTPNGYFGPSTFAAVKAYQRLQGLSQVGVAGPGTRAAIKKESCTTSAPTQAQAQNQVSTTTPVGNQTVTTTANVPIAPHPVINSFDYVSLFAGGMANWNFSMYGTNFSTTSNTVVFRNIETRKSYTIGTLPASATGTLALPTNLTGTAYDCGVGCKEKMEAGKYEVTVTTAGGTSDPKLFTILPFTMSALTTAVNTIPAAVTGLQLGEFSFSTSQAVTVKSIQFSFSTSTISAGGLGNIVLKDQMTGQIISPDTELQAIQSGLVSVYGDANNTTPGTIYGTFSVTIRDYIGNHDTTFTSNPIMMTVAGVL